MAIVFKTPKSTLNTTSKQIQNLGGDCPPCPEPVLEGKELEYTQNGEYTVTPEQGVDGFSSIDVTVNVPSDVNNQNKTVSPSTSSQTVEADSGYSGLGTVTVNAVTSSIDNNISAGNIKKDVTILGVNGTYDPQPTLAMVTVVPTTSAQTITPPASIDGYSRINVTAVTSSIDQNIAAGNIKSGVSILGVTGTYEGSGGTNVPDWSSIGFTNNDVQGVVDAVGYSADVKSEYIDNNQFVPESIWYKMSYWPSGVYEKYNANPYFGTTMPQIMKDVTWYWDRGPSWAQTSFFSGFSGLQKIDSISFVDTNNNTIKPQGLYRCFNRCKSLKEIPAIDTSEATDVTGMFQDCTSLTRINGSLDLSSATSMYQMFSGCESLQTFPQILNTSGVTSLQECFQKTNCENYPLFNTAGVTNVKSMFFQAHSLISTNHPTANIPAYDFSSVIEVDSMFASNAFYYNDSDTPVTFAGFTNLGKAFTGANIIYHTLDLSRIGEAGETIVIPKQSLMNIINALSAPDDATCTDATLKLSAKQYGMLDASDIAIATAKNWSVISA